MPMADGAELGRRLVDEMRHPLDDESFDASATAVLRWGADELDDDTLWAAAMSAVDCVANDGERWSLGDGLIDESIAMRPNLCKRWQDCRTSHPGVSEVYRVMTDPSWNWCHNAESWWLCDDQ